MKKSFTRITPNCSDEIVNKSQSAILFVVDSISEIFANAFPGRNIKIVKKTAEDWKHIKTDLAYLLSSDYDRIFFLFTNPIDDRNLLMHISELTDENRELRKRIVVLVHTTPKALPPSALSQFQILGNFSNHPLAFEADKDFINGLLEPGESNALTVSIGEQQEICAPSSFILPAEDLKVMDLFSTENEKQLVAIINNYKDELSKIKDDKEAYRARLELIYEKGKVLFRIIGFFVAIAGLLTIVFILRNILPNLETNDNDNWFNIMIKLFIDLFRESIKHGMFLIFGITLVIVGSAFMFEIGFNVVYSYAKANIENALIVQKDNSQKSEGKIAK
jgi:hypothetical protein